MSAKVSRSARVRRAVLERDGHRCRRCDDDGQVEAHHVQAIQDEGPDTLDNQVTLCVLCHREWTFVAEPGGVPWTTFMVLPSIRFLAAVVDGASKDPAHYVTGMHAMERTAHEFARYAREDAEPRPLPPVPFDVTIMVRA